MVDMMNIFLTANGDLNWLSFVIAAIIALGVVAIFNDNDNDPLL